MFDDERKKRSEANYWKLYAVILAALLTADLISGIVTNTLIAYKMNTVSAQIDDTTRQFNSIINNANSAFTPKINLKEQRERKKELIIEECRYWIDLYNSNPTKENSINRSRACKPIGIY